MSRIDTHLLEQYVDMLGYEGVQASLSTFRSLMPDYYDELETFVAVKDSASVRRQAHKMKGACRSLGFVALAKYMEQIEKDAWQWGFVNDVLEKWPTEVSQDIVLVEQWLLPHAAV
ncbi:Hpt domain-containing protein [Aliidiomarina celeris]|uniref:Hpt domain-containing protein n=1 Tax=Aliidiomarina celeris TaxID=2249428 RepID=UPI000DE80370|nr:Hpt domain-containing protein [Aliidiomarina celeris]